MPWSGIKTKRTFYERKKRSVIEIRSCTKIKLLTRPEDAVLRNAVRNIYKKFILLKKGEVAPLLQGVLNNPIPSAAADAKFAQEDGHAGIKIIWQRRR